MAIMSSPSVIIVGNGGSLLGSGLGPFIDSHAVVVRFNLFRTGPFAADVGTRTSVWFNNRDAHPPQIAAMLKRHVFDRIHIHTWTRTGEAAQSFRDALKRLDRATPVLEVPKTVIDDMQACLGAPYRMFSTGAIGTWMMLREHDHVTLTGFDWWQPQPATPFHYGDSQTFTHHPAQGHQPALEEQLFRKLEAAGRLRFHAAGVAPKNEAAGL